MNGFEHMAIAQTRLITSGAGVLKHIVVNTTAAGTISIYNNTTAVAADLIAVLKSNIAEGTYKYDVRFTKGLTIVTAAASDITIVFT